MYKPLEEMKGLCKSCVGDCLRLELEEFEGTYNCTGYEKKPTAEDYIKQIKINLGDKR